MTIMHWEDRFDLGVDAMNDEHRHLVELMNRVHDLWLQDAPKPTVLVAIDELARYTVQHFRDEEAYMARISFPQLTPHKIIHERLLKTLGEHRETIASSDRAVPNEFFNFLKFWLSAHICGVDMKYGEFANKKSA